MVGRPFAEDADHGVGFVVESNLPAHNRGIAAEAILPDTIGEEDDPVTADGALLFGEAATERQRVPVAHHPEEPGRGKARQHVLRPVGRGQVDAPAAPRVEVVERGRLALPGDEVPGRDRDALPAELRPHHHQRLGVAIRQRREEGAVDDAENGGGRSDAEGEHHDRQARERWGPAEQSDGESRVAEQSGHGWSFPREVKSDGSRSVRWQLRCRVPHRFFKYLRAPGVQPWDGSVRPRATRHPRGTRRSGLALCCEARESPQPFLHAALL